MKPSSLIYSLCFSFLLLLTSGSLKASPLIQHDQENVYQLVAKGDSLFHALQYDEALGAYQNALVKQDYKQTDEAVAIINKIADLHYQRGEFDLAYQYYNQAITLSTSNKSKGKGRALMGKAQVLWRYGDNAASTKNISESIEIFEYLRDTTNLIEAQGVLGGIYVSVKKYEEGEKLYKRMLTLSMENNDSVNIAQSFEYLGIIAFFRKHFHEALNYYHQALDINTRLGKPLKAALNRGNMGEAYLDLGELEAAKENLQKALTVEKSYDFNSGIIFIYYTLGKVHHASDDYGKALEFYQRSLAIMNKTGEIREKNLVYRLISENYAASGDYKLAFQYHQRYSEAKDSLFNKEKNRQLEEAQAKYEIREKEKENSRLYADNIRQREALEAKEAVIKYQYLIGIIVLVFLFVLLLLFFRLDKRRKQLAKANTTKNILFRVISHDLNGPIHNIHALLKIAKTESEEEKERILEMLLQASGKTSLMVKDLLSWSATQQSGFAFTMESLNLKSATDQCINLLSYQIQEKGLHIHNEMDEEHFVWADRNAISTIIRNLLSNAIKFSVPRGQVYLRSELLKEKKRRMIKVSVLDSGVGFSEEIKQKILNDKPIKSKAGTFREKGTGLGFTLVKEFVKESGGKLEIYNIPEGGGVVSFTLPFSDASV